jgi:molecular chaperone GrpE
MNDETKPQDDPAVAEELRGVPEELIDRARSRRGPQGAPGRARDGEAGSALRQGRDTERPAPAREGRRRHPRLCRDRLCPRHPLGRRQPVARARIDPDELREDDKLKSLVAGIEATAREIDKVFGLHGISRIAAKGLPLDPNQHQAMVEIPSNDAEPGTVVQELQAGYMIKDRLLRPAMVAVAKKPD